MQNSSRIRLGQNCSLNAFVSICNNNNNYYYGNTLYWGCKTKILSQEMTHCLHSQLSARFLGKNLRYSMHKCLSSQKAVRPRRAAGECFTTTSHLSLHLCSRENTSELQVRPPRISERRDKDGNFWTLKDKSKELWFWANNYLLQWKALY